MNYKILHDFLNRIVDLRQVRRKILQNSDTVRFRAYCYEKVPC